MSGRPSTETVMEALFAVLTAGMQVAFTATLAQGSNVLASPSSTAGLSVGMPLFGAEIPAGSSIATLTPTLTMTLAALGNDTAEAITAGCQTFGRRVRHFEEVTAQPALFLRTGDSEVEWQEQTQHEAIEAEIWILSNSGRNPTVIPEIELNNLVDAVKALMVPDSTPGAGYRQLPQIGRYTIGGLVYWCRVAGRIEKDPGDQDGQAIAKIPVQIIIP